MDIIENYLNSVYGEDNSKDAKELKEELLEHLRLSTSDFMKQGYSLETAQQMAINQFDDEGENSIELRTIYTKKIDVKKEKVRKLMKLRWDIINLTGCLFGAIFVTSTVSLYKRPPGWLMVLTIISIVILIIINLILFPLKKSIHFNKE